MGVCLDARGGDARDPPGAGAHLGDFATLVDFFTAGDMLDGHSWILRIMPDAYAKLTPTKNMSIQLAIQG
jgi:hypothetical protein